MKPTKPKFEMIELTDAELKSIQWRATRGSHFETDFLVNSQYARQVVEDDVPRLIMEIRRLRAKHAPIGVTS